ncbi:NAD(P)/FAD-dependent oxidoreductase [Thalassospira sp. A3_1]|uniref:NAD(P)/FAD-dependent oxidoreductase n=1 Tax=Thalassospira sp. A3_1 TaxID=2821088 RepID=UPI001AD9B72C|nr:NAD(P)/FAD-dependent oxidoreductase [Thalassospira sp. A3_1]MBO9507871.1 NAD(P)/FAD-dependent oxidoreductase [Thalassospira sp. A3_1]
MSDAIPTPSATQPVSMPDSEKLYDVIIIGAGFAGLSAAMQLARARKQICIIDAGLPRNRFAAASHGFFGLDGQSPDEISCLAMAQIRAYPTVSIVHGMAKAASRLEPDAAGTVNEDNNRFKVSLDDGRRFQARRLILATGVVDTLPDIPGLMPRWGKTVLHCPYCHGYEVRDRTLGVLATGPMSIHQAMMIPDWGPTIFFTQGKYEPEPEIRAQMDARGITIEQSPIVGLIGAAPDLEAVKLADGRSMPIQALFAGPTVSMTNPLSEMLGCAFEEGIAGPFIKVDASQETSIPGVFAAGDAATARHNATLASAAGVLAGVGAHQSLIFS